MAPATLAGNLQIEIAGIDHSRGKLLITLFSDPVAFKVPETDSADYNALLAQAEDREPEYGLAVGATVQVLVHSLSAGYLYAF